MEEIYERRSYRKYNEKNIEDDILKEILKAGMNAPSSWNSKPWEFIIVSDKTILESLSQVTDFSGMIANCNKAIVVVGKDEKKHWQQDLAACTQNILLMATKKEIGSCWIGVAPDEVNEKKVKDILNVPQEYRAFSIISLGYYDTKKENNNIFSEDKIHYNNF